MSIQSGYDKEIIMDKVEHDMVALSNEKTLLSLRFFQAHFEPTTALTALGTINPSSYAFNARNIPTIFLQWAFFRESVDETVAVL